MATRTPAVVHIGVFIVFCVWCQSFALVYRVQGVTSEPHTTVMGVNGAHDQISVFETNKKEKPGEIINT